MSWSPSSWREKKIAQDVVYPESTASSLPSVTSQLRSLPPLVVSDEVERLRTQLAQVAKGRAFLLQGGDCAELFQYCQKEPIESKVRLLLLMSLIMWVWRSFAMFWLIALSTSSASGAVECLSCESFEALVNMQK